MASQVLKAIHLRAITSATRVKSMNETHRNPSGLVKWPTVRIEELREIDRRRIAAGLLPATPMTTVSDAPKENPANLTTDGDADKRCREHASNLVGLAFSGGGIRSASFNLGLLQALQETGVLRHVDLLSTVSGGGYIGSHLSSLALREDTSLDKDKFPLTEEPGGKQPARVIQFLRNGRYMVAQPLRFTGAYIFGTLLNNVVVISGLLAICTLIALIWRTLDTPRVHDIVKSLTLGYATDYHRPFIPAAIFFVLWLVTRIYGIYASKGRSLLPTVLFACIASSILIGIAVLLGNGDISGLEIVNTQSRYAVWILCCMLLIGLIPTLRPWRFLQSGTNTKTKSELLIFRMSSTALLVGIPLAVTYYVARENCSGFGTARTELTPGDIHDWSIISEIETISERSARLQQGAMSAGAMMSLITSAIMDPAIQALRNRTVSETAGPAE